MYISKLPVNYIERREESEMVIDALIHKRTTNITALTAALRGAGGFGKSTLANAVCADIRIKKTFSDGIFWVDLGEKISSTLIAEKINHLLKALGMEYAAFTDFRDASKKLRETLANRRVLLVIDDVWNNAHLDPFLQGGVECAHLVTTRDSNTLPLDTNIILVDSASPRQALQMLSKDLPKGEDDLLLKLSEKLWNWPLLLGLANGQLRREVHQNHATLGTAVEKALQLYESRGLTAFDLKNPIERNQAAGLALDISVEQMTSFDRENLILLAVFPENTVIPLTALQALWGRTTSLKESDVTAYCSQFASASFIQQYDVETSSFRIHAVIHEYLALKLDNRRLEAHRDLIEGYLDEFSINSRQWWLVPDDHYFYQHLVYHLLAANMQKTSVDLLFNYMWLKTALKIGGVPAVVRDCEAVIDFDTDNHEVCNELRLLQDFFRLSAHVLIQDQSQLPSQILGRLAGLGSKNFIQLIEKAQLERSFIWLSPTQRYFTPPGGSELMTFEGHSRSVTILALSNDERLLASGSEEGVIKVWDIESGECLHTLRGHPSNINGLAFTRNGKLVVSSSKNGLIKIWDNSNGVCLHTIDESPEEITSLVVTTDGKYVVFETSSGKIQSWRLDGQRKLHLIERTKGLRRVNLLTAENKCIISLTSDKTIKIWDVDREQSLFSLEGHDQPIFTTAMSLDGKRLISVSSTNILKFWDIERGVCLQTFSQKLTGETKIIKVALTVSGKRALVVTDDYKVKVWDPERGKPINLLKGHDHHIQAIAMTPDEKLAISVSNDRTLKVWSLATSECLATLRGHTDRINTLVLTKDGQRAYSGARDKTIKVWNINAAFDLNDSIKIRNQGNNYDSNRHSSPVNVIVLDPKGKFAVSASQDKTGKIWRIENGVCLYTLNKHEKPLNALALTPDGMKIATGAGDGNIMIWDTNNGKCLNTIKVKAKYNLPGITALAITPDGRQIISGSKDSTIDVWMMDTYKNIRSLIGHKTIKYSNEQRAFPKAQGITTLAVSPSGTRIVSAGSDCMIKIWDIESGKCLRTLKEHRRFVADIAITPDSEYLVSASYDSRLKIWEIETGRCVRTLNGHLGPVRSVKITPDGKHAISGSSDGTLRVWDLYSGNCLNTLLGHSDRVNDIELSHNGKWIASAANDKTIKIWDRESSRCLVTFRGDVPFYTVSFSFMPPTTIVAGDHKGNVLFLRVMELENISTL